MQAPRNAQGRVELIAAASKMGNFLSVEGINNLALQGYWRVHARSGRWLVEFGWGMVVG